MKVNKTLSEVSHYIGTETEALRRDKGGRRGGGEEFHLRVVLSPNEDVYTSPYLFHKCVSVLQIYNDIQQSPDLPLTPSLSSRESCLFSISDR